jgi:DNA-binding NtrC family response regulator
MDVRTTNTVPLPEKPVTVLLVSAHQTDRTSLQHILACTCWKLQVRTDWRDGLALLRQSRVPVVICDSETTDGDWRSLLHKMAYLPDAPKLIVSSRLADERLWAEVLNLGGYDVLATPFDPGEVLQACFSAWQNWEHIPTWSALTSAAGD